MSSDPTEPAQPLLIHCRRLSAGDTPEVAQLELESFREPWSRAMVLCELANPDCHAVGISNRPLGQHQPLCGYALFRLAPPTAELIRIATSPLHRGQGLANTLLTYCHEQLAVLGGRESFLEVRTSNTAAIALYRRHRYLEVGKRANYYPDGTDALVMRASIERPRNSKLASQTDLEPPV